MKPAHDLLARFWLRRCTRVGAAPKLGGKPWIVNEGRFEIGDSVSIASAPVPSHLVVARGGLLSLGDGVCVGQGAAIAVRKEIRVGARARLGDFVAIADTDFHVVSDRKAKPPNTPVLIGERVQLGSWVTVLRGVTIGDGAVIASGSVVRGSVAPGAFYSGLPPRAPAALADDVHAVVRRTLGARAALAPSSLDADSALMLLLALEEEFGVSLDPAGLRRVSLPAALVGLVEEARAAQVVA